MACGNRESWRVATGKSVRRPRIHYLHIKMIGPRGSRHPLPPRFRNFDSPGIARWRGLVWKAGEVEPTTLRVRHPHLSAMSRRYSVPGWGAERNASIWKPKKTRRAIVLWHCSIKEIQIVKVASMSHITKEENCGGSECYGSFVSGTVAFMRRIKSGKFLKVATAF